MYTLYIYNTLLVELCFCLWESVESLLNFGDKE